MGMRTRAFGAVVAAAGLLLPVGANRATAVDGPSLDVPESTLAAAFACPAGFSHPEHEPVLLVHGTATTAEESWSWGYQITLPSEAGIDVCTVELPDRALGDIQTAAEYVVYAVRAMAAATGQRIGIVGHSQGGLEPRWAVRWWPDVAASVADVVTLASDNQGTVTADASCAFDCAPAIWQQRTVSNFIAALNEQPTVPGVAYTSIYSLTDELVQPAAVDAVAVIPGGSNVLVQGLCPGRPAHHIAPLFDAVYWSVMVDALTHDGPADSSRVPLTVCAQFTAPGIDPDVAARNDATLYSNAVAAFGAHPHVASEPPLRDYAAG